MAKATVSVATFGGIQVLSITSMCTVGTNIATSSAVYKGQTITAPTTIVVSGYTLLFNQPATNGTTTGRTALTIITPAGATVLLATSQCQGAYPIVVTTTTSAVAPSAAQTKLGAQRPARFTSPAGNGSTRSLPATLVLGLAICAFVAVNVFGVRTFRRRQGKNA